ncbi:serine hydrolase [Flavobacterium sp. WLB]|uniref:serine hydrolase domain-containing protein n=1 Tax=unclassified Flavobacterium TaxID=196869 RepID=UPI0006ABC56F|nr:MULTISPECIES: serine hydrolase [unclassified Flavobacterium]KOP37500.1 beta-lactamase [Flavobacterium sp. VMW]OWU92392.1 serine hydrolase [Flavobacterium sp. NLM]PUU70950.1 serine hydrolase [Flavobacterium sp. WLB]
MTRIILFLLLSFCGKIAAQNDLYKADEITYDIHKANIGKVTFMNGNIPLAEYKKTDILKSFELKPRSDLNIRVFMDNSVVNYLHQLAPKLPAETLLKTGNLQFSFYVDGKLIYTENIHHGCNFGSGGNKNTSTVFRVPLTSTKGEDWWAMNMWERFKNNGGEKALNAGTHELKIELRPYIKIGDTIKTGNLIAEGELKLLIKPIVLTKKQIEVQQIQPGSDWEISNQSFDKKKIEELNSAIGTYNLKEITSVVVIHNGKLLLEEYFNDANRNTLHDTRSAGKSFASTMMGIAIDESFIKNENQTLNTFYDLKQFTNYEPKKDSVKIRDLLTMSSAFEGSDSNGDSPGNEDNMYPAENWVKFALNLPMDKTKTNGGQWDYFTAGVVVLGDIINKMVPQGLEKYADEKLFKPLHITNYQWQYTPQKVPNTAGSLQMTSLEYAKYAQLYKNNGLWNGKQILSAEWISKTFTKQIQIPERNNEFYGYLFWNKTFAFEGKNYETFYCAGNGGNQFIVFKELPLVIIITSKAYNKQYAHPQAEKIVKDYILPAVLDYKR